MMAYMFMILKIKGESSIRRINMDEILQNKKRERMVI